MIYLTDIEGLLADLADPASLISQIDAGGTPGADRRRHAHGRDDPQDRRLPARGGATACGSAHLLDGRLPHVLLLELFSDEGIGTMITEEPVA